MNDNHMHAHHEHTICNSCVHTAQATLDRQESSPQSLSLICFLGGSAYVIGDSIVSSLWLSKPRGGGSWILDPNSLEYTPIS